MQLSCNHPDTRGRRWITALLDKALQNYIESQLCMLSGLAYLWNQRNLNENVCLRSAFIVMENQSDHNQITDPMHPETAGMSQSRFCLGSESSSHLCRVYMHNELTIGAIDPKLCLHLASWAFPLCLLTQRISLPVKWPEYLER